MTKIWYPVKIQLLSLTCEDITVVMATSVSANRKRASQHLDIVVYIINRVELEDKIRIHKRACNIRYILKCILIEKKKSVIPRPFESNRPYLRCPLSLSVF